MERMRQMSSAQDAMLGMKSENSIPDWPAGLKTRGLASTAAVGLVNASFMFFVMSAGSGLPFHFASSGFGSYRSSWLGPPSTNMKMTFLALAGSGGFFGASGFTSAIPEVAPR